MLSKDPRSEDVDKMWLILFRGSSKAEEAKMWFLVIFIAQQDSGAFLSTSGI